MNSVKSLIQQVSEGFRSLIYWFPVIWSDRNFDHNYLYRILHHKLSGMESFFRSEWAYTVCAKERAEEIAEAKEIVWRLINDTYFTEKLEGIKDEEIFSFANGKFEIDREHPYYKKWEESIELADKEREDDKQKLFKLLTQKVDHWWD